MEGHLNPTNPQFVLSKNTTEKDISGVKKLGETNPKQADIVMASWAKEILKKVEKNPISPENQDKNLSKEKVEQLLNSIEAKFNDYLGEAISDINNLEKSTKNLYLTEKLNEIEFLIDTSKTGVSIQLTFPQVNGSVEYELYKDAEMDKDDSMYITLTNAHREVSPNLRGYGIAKWLEKNISKIAKSAEIKELYFQSRDKYNSVVFPLTQGYECRNQKDREQVIEILKYIYDHPEEYNNKREESFLNLIYFKKQLISPSKQQMIPKVVHENDDLQNILQKKLNDLRGKN